MEHRYTPAVLAALAFTIVYIAAAGLGVVLIGDLEFVVYLGVTATATTVVAGLHHRVGFSPMLVWGLSVLGALHMAGGLVRPPREWPVDGRRVLYNLWLMPGRLRFDQAVHFYGAAVSTWACYQCLKAGTSLSRPAVGPVALCVLAGTGLGAVNEVAEFLTTQVVADTNVGGFENTGWDLVANLAGATLAGLLLWQSANGREGTTRPIVESGEPRPPRL